MYGAVVVQEILQRRQEPWRYEHSGWPLEVDNHQPEKLPKNSMWTILWSFSIWSKLERWKISVGGYPWADCQSKKKKKENHHFELLSPFILCNQLFLAWIVSCNDKWILYDNQWWPSQWLDQEEAPKHFLKPNLHQKKSWSLFGGLLPIWSTTAFWIQVKPLHLRNMFSKSMRYTENCNACSQHWSTERAQFFSTKTSNCTLHNQCLKSWVSLQSFASSTIFTWPLANGLPLLQASWQLFAGKRLTQTAEVDNAFQEFIES